MARAILLKVFESAVAATFIIASSPESTIKPSCSARKWRKLIGNLHSIFRYEDSITGGGAASGKLTATGTACLPKTRADAARLAGVGAATVARETFAPLWIIGPLAKVQPPSAPVRAGRA